MRSVQSRVQGCWFNSSPLPIRDDRHKCIGRRFIIAFIMPPGDMLKLSDL